MEMLRIILSIRKSRPELTSKGASLVRYCDVNSCIEMLAIEVLFCAGEFCGLAVFHVFRL